MGRFFTNFTSGTAKLGNVNVGESYGASIVMKHGANVTLEVAGGKINDSHNGDGFEVWTRAEGADDYLRVSDFDTESGYTKGCEGLTIKKVGEGTLVYGLTKALTQDGAQRFAMFAANSLSGAVATENGGYAPEGSEKHGAWIVRLSRSADNVVEFRPYVRIGLAVKIR